MFHGKPYTPGPESILVLNHVRSILPGVVTRPYLYANMCPSVEDLPETLGALRKTAIYVCAALQKRRLVAKHTPARTRSVVNTDIVDDIVLVDVDTSVLETDVVDVAIPVDVDVAVDATAVVLNGNAGSSVSLKASNEDNFTCPDIYVSLFQID